ncbi:MAG TPA: UbiA family prenyltransferase [Terracidiphilus sp.]|nr:UbiA family prenyltransferase [Terracidiphilus sp.]
MSLSTLPTRTGTLRQRLWAHASLLRLDHSVKQIFVLPGIVIAASLTDAPLDRGLLVRTLLGLTAVMAAASSNYVLNELLDAPFDRLHPTKRLRPAASRTVSIPLAYAQWLIVGAIGFVVALEVSMPLFFSVLSLWVMGCFYNIPPIRTKDVPYLDVLSESVNNPIRLCVGWYVVTATVIPPASLLVAYWMLGAYFMALKRFSEYRQIGRDSAVKYRRSFELYNEQSLLTSVLFYGSTAMLFFGAFIMRYRMEMVFAFPFIALLMASYFKLSFVEDSPVQNPEKLYREPRIMALLVICCLVLIAMLYIDLPWLGRVFPRSGVHNGNVPQATLSIPIEQRLS